MEEYAENKEAERQKWKLECIEKLEEKCLQNEHEHEERIHFFQPSNRNTDYHTVLAVIHHHHHTFLLHLTLLLLPMSLLPTHYMTSCLMNRVRRTNNTYNEDNAKGEQYL